MKALTIRPPWTNAIMDWSKDVENRTRNLVGAYRGPLAIHVSTTGVDARGWRAIDQFSRVPIDPDRIQLQPGYVIGVVDLVDAHRYPSCLDADGAHCSWWAEQIPGMWHLVLENPRRLQYPMWIRGRLGLWEFPDEKLDGRWPAEVLHG